LGDVGRIVVTDCQRFLHLLLLFGVLRGRILGFFIDLHRFHIRNFRSVSGTATSSPIPKDRVPAGAMIGWHVARHWAAGDGASTLK